MRRDKYEIVKKNFYNVFVTFSSQQVLAKDITTKQELIKFYNEMGQDLAKMIDLVEEIDSKATKNKDLIVFLSNSNMDFFKTIIKKTKETENKFIVAAIDLEQENLLDYYAKITEISPNDLKGFRKFIAELDEMIDKIKPKSKEEALKIQDLKNLTNFYKKIAKIKEFAFETQEKYKKYDFLNIFSSK